jgi:hypothetical protein
MGDMRKEKLKNAVRYFYDLQALRIQSGARASKKAELAQAHLDEEDKEFLKRTGKSLNALERDALKEVERLLQGIPIYEKFLKDVRGIGPTLSGVLISEIHIENCNTVSQLWAWCGLAVVDGKAVKRKRGEKLTFNPWLKSKLLKVMGDCLLKAVSRDEDGYFTKTYVRDAEGKLITENVLDEDGHVVLDEDGEEKLRRKTERVPWPKNVTCFRKFCDDYKHRKENQQVETCMGCEGSGDVTRVERDKVVDIGTKKPRKKSKCPNCEGTGGPAPWGASKAHRHAAANRYMVKMFLQELWGNWRELEGLEVRPPYAEEYLGRVHHS